MGNAVKDQVLWKLRGNLAELNSGKLSARTDASRPNEGLQHVTFDGAKLATDLLCVYRSDVIDNKSWPLPAAESYVRGRDLVASYHATNDWPFSPQLYWRANSLHGANGVLASISLLVSVQTHLLDTVPQIAVSSQVSCDETLLVSVNDDGQLNAVLTDSSQTIPRTNEDCCIVSRLKDISLSYVEIMPAGDFHAIRIIEEGNRTAFEWRLFDEFLEKGVIRRARVHAAIVPRDKDIESAAECCKAIDGLELPLTT